MCVLDFFFFRVGSWFQSPSGSEAFSFSGSETWRDNCWPCNSCLSVFFFFYNSGAVSLPTQLCLNEEVSWHSFRFGFLIGTPAFAQESSVGFPLLLWQYTSLFTTLSTLSNQPTNQPALTTHFNFFCGCMPRGFFLYFLAFFKFFWKKKGFQHPLSSRIYLVICARHCQKQNSGGDVFPWRSHGIRTELARRQVKRGNVVFR